MTLSSPDDYLYRQVREILAKSDAGMDLTEVIAWLRRLQTQHSSLSTGYGISLNTIDSLLNSVEDAQTGIQATNNRINSLVALLDEITERLGHQATALNHLMAANEPIEETPLEWAKRKAVELCKTLFSKIAG